MANFIERLIKLTVDNGQANTALVSTEKNLNKVDASTTKVTQSTKTMTKETHNATEAVVKNGGAIGLLNDLTGGLAMVFKDASEAMELAGVSLNSFKGIMLATGIGAFVLLVGYLAENWQAVGDALGITNSKLEKQIELQNQVEANSEARRASQQTYIDILTLGIDTVTEKQLALEKLAETIPVLKGLSVTKDKELIQQTISDYNDYLDIQEQIKNKTKEINDASLELKKTKDDIIGGKGSIAYANKEQELFQSKRELDSLETKELRLKAGLKITEEKIAADKKAAENAKTLADKAAAEEAARIARLTALREANNKKLLELDDDTAIKKIDRQEKYALRELEIVRGNERDKNVVRSYYERLRQEEYSKGRKTEAEADKKAFEDWQANLVKQWEQLQLNKQQEIELQRITNDAKFESWMRYWDDVAMISETSQAFLQALQDESLIKSKDVRNAILLLEKGMAIANVWITEAQASAVAKQNESAIPYFIQTYPGGPSVPNPAKPFSLASTAKSIVANKINAGIATASILAQTISSFSKSSGGSSSAGGSGGGTGSAPQFNIVGASGNNQLAAAIGAQQQQPVTAYVVGSSMTTQQALDRNRTQTATFL